MASFGAVLVSLFSLAWQLQRCFGELQFTPAVAPSDCDVFLQVEAITSSEHQLNVSAVANRQESAARAIARFARPNLGGPAEQVRIGLLIKSIDAIDMKAGTVYLDVVMTVQWTDERFSTVLPKGVDSVTLTLPTAKEIMWLPNVGITNKDIKGEEVVSAAIKVEGTTATQVERRIVKVRSEFDMTAFPFDSQRISLRAASLTHMADEVELVTTKDSEHWGIPAELFEGSEFVKLGATFTAFMDIDGALQKSRAELGIEVDHRASAYFPSLIAAPLALLFIAVTVFHLPLMHGFAMPRTGTSIVILLAVMSHRQACQSLLPSHASLSWVDVWSEGNLVLVFFTLIFQVAVEHVKHQHGEEIAETMNKELKLVFPTLVVVHVLLSFSMVYKDMVHLLSMMSRILLLGALAVYAILSQRRLMKLAAAAPQAFRT